MIKIKLITYSSLRGIQSYNANFSFIEGYIKSSLKANKFFMEFDDFSLLQKILIYQNIYNTGVIHIIIENGQT